MQLQSDLEYLRNYMHKVFYSILLNSASRDATLKYIAEVLQRNIRRQQMQVNERTVAGDGFMLNLLSVMQHLSAKVSLNQVWPLTQPFEVFFFAVEVSERSRVDQHLVSFGQTNEFLPTMRSALKCVSDQPCP